MIKSALIELVIGICIVKTKSIETNLDLIKKFKSDQKYLNSIETLEIDLIYLKLIDLIDFLDHFLQSLTFS